VKPLKDAKSTVRGLGAEALEELDAPPPSSRAVNAIAPTPSSRPGSYSHMPPRRNTRELALDANHIKNEPGGTLRPPPPSDPET
jgi:hypothetical protein